MFLPSYYMHWLADANIFRIKQLAVANKTFLNQVMYHGFIRR